MSLIHPSTSYKKKHASNSAHHQNAKTLLIIRPVIPHNQIAILLHIKCHDQDFNPKLPATNNKFPIISSDWNLNLWTWEYSKAINTKYQKSWYINILICEYEIDTMKSVQVYCLRNIASSIPRFKSLTDRGHSTKVV